MEFIMYDKKFEKCVCDYEGTEAKLYINNSNLYKIYIKDKGYSFLHLMALNDRQKYIENTVLPNGIIFDSNRIKGCSIKYFENYKELLTIKDNNILDKVRLLKKTLINLKEITDNYIYPRDLNINGILVFVSDIKIIDLDTHRTIINNKRDNELLKYVLQLYRNIFFEILYFDFDPIFSNFDIKSFLENKKINSKIIKLISTDKINYSNFFDYINYIENENKYCK